MPEVLFVGESQQALVAASEALRTPSMKVPTSAAVPPSHRGVGQPSSLGSGGSGGRDCARWADPADEEATARVKYGIIKDSVRPLSFLSEHNQKLSPTLEMREAKCVHRAFSGLSVSLVSTQLGPRLLFAIGKYELLRGYNL